MTCSYISRENKLIELKAINSAKCTPDFYNIIYYIKEGLIDAIYS